MSCLQTIADYGLRSIGIGERLLPKADITLCQQFTLIGSGLIWNVYFALCALILGFGLSISLALARNSASPWLRKPADWFIFVFRGSPLFIQFFLNTSAYAGEIFHGALRSVPKGDLEAADAYGFSGFKKFRRITFPTMLRLGWPAYTNEAIFLTHATTLVYFSSFPAWQQKGDALYYANYFADKTFNPFISYPILAFYFILLSLAIIFLYGRVYRHLNRHLPQARKPRLRPRPQLMR